MIYFAQLPTGAIKIGYSENVDKRISQLGWHYQAPLSVLHTLPGGPAEESALHEKFAHLRYGITEQFRPAPELLAFIGKPLLASPNPDAVEMVDLKAVRIDASLASMARLIAGAKGITIGQYLEPMIGTTIKRDYAAMMKHLEKGGVE